MSVLKEQVCVNKTAGTLWVLILAHATMATLCLSMDLAVQVSSRKNRTLLLSHVAKMQLKQILLDFLMYSLLPIAESDNDECRMRTAMCAQTCQDTQGSYMCGCRAGYALHRDGRTCTGKVHSYNKYVFICQVAVLDI